MTEDEKKPPASSDAADLRSELERLSAENLVLKQQMEFQRLFADYQHKQTELFGQHKKDVEGEINKRLVGMSLLGLVVAGLAWWSTITPVRKMVTDRLDREFASDSIRVLISDAAQRAAASQTKQLIEGTLKPATDQALSEIAQQREQVTHFVQQVQRDTGAQILQVRRDLQGQGADEKRALDNLHKDYTASLAKLDALVDYQERLKEIELLKSETISGNVDSFKKLDSYQSSDATLLNAAQSAGIEAKIAYISANRVAGNVSVWLLNPDGSRGKADNDIPTVDLIAQFLLNQNQRWEFRDKAAEILSARREPGVPPALLNCMNNDPNLWVRRAALRSFEGITSFREQDVFDFRGASTWWDTNKDSYEHSLP